MTSLMDFRVNGSSMKALTPISRACSRDMFSLYPVMRMTGMSGCMASASHASCSPFTPTPNEGRKNLSQQVLRDYSLAYGRTEQPFPSRKRERTIEASCVHHYL